MRHRSHSERRDHIMMLLVSRWLFGWLVRCRPTVTVEH